MFSSFATGFGLVAVICPVAAVWLKVYCLHDCHIIIISTCAYRDTSKIICEWISNYKLFCLWASIDFWTYQSTRSNYESICYSICSIYFAIYREFDIERIWLSYFWSAIIAMLFDPIYILWYQDHRHCIASDLTHKCSNIFCINAIKLRDTIYGMKIIQLWVQIEDDEHGDRCLCNILVTVICNKLNFCQGCEILFKIEFSRMKFSEIVKNILT